MFVKPSAWGVIPTGDDTHSSITHTECTSIHTQTDTHLLPAALTNLRICLHGACLSLLESRWTDIFLPGFLIGPVALPWVKDLAYLSLLNKGI